jgi:hypothetical protein
MARVGERGETRWGGVGCIRFDEIASLFSNLSNTRLFELSPHLDRLLFVDLLLEFLKDLKVISPEVDSLILEGHLPSLLLTEM